MKQLKNIAWFLPLVVVFFILHGIVENFGFIYFSELVKITLLIAGCVALFYLFIKIFIKDKLHAALVCFFISSWLLFFGAIFEWVKSVRFLYWLHSYTVFVPFMLLVFLLFILFIRKKTKLWKKACFYLNVLLLIYCVFDICALILKSVQPDNQAIYKPISFDTAAVKIKPNVYLLLFDEYPGYKSLKDSFAFSNDALYQFFAEKEFKFLPFFSNYNMTFYSMASMLNMQYIDKPFIPLQNTFENDQQRLKEIKNAEVIQYFKAMGYRFINYSIFDILDQPSVKGNSFVISQATLITNKIFFNKILKDIGWNFIDGRYKLPYFKYIFMYEDRNNKFIEKSLRENKLQNSLSPQFIYAHFNMPHPPIFYDSIGNYLPIKIMLDQQSYFDKQNFLSQLKYTNTKIESLVTKICKNDPAAIVIVMSDHGYRGYNNANTIEPLHFDNICAIRFPDKNYLPTKEKWSSVNFFRYLFNCEFNQQIPYVSDSSIFLKDKTQNN